MSKKEKKRKKKAKKYTERKIITNKYLENINGTANFFTGKDEISMMKDDRINIQIESNEGKVAHKVSRKIPDILTTLPLLDEGLTRGREREVNAIHNLTLSTGKIVLIQGEKGTGKTTFLKMYLHSKRANYQHLAWVDVEEGVSVIKSLANHPQLSDSLILDTDHQFKNEMEETRHFHRVTNMLRKLPGNNLLIIDNAGEDADQTDVYDYIKLENNWTVLVSSEADNMETFERYELKPLPENDLLQVFELNYYKPIDGQFPLVKEIISLLHKNTGDVVFVANRASKLRLDLKEIIERIKSSGLESFKVQ
ncbi:MAG: AAA family ATPase [Bacteroidota bacterium]